MKKIIYIAAVLTCVELTGCATRKLINETSAITNSPTSLVNGRKCGDKLIVIYSAQSINESAGEVKFIAKASVFTKPENKNENNLIGENINLEIDPFLERKPLTNPPPFSVADCEKIPILKENCDEKESSIVICGRSPSEFRIGIAENTLGRKWYNAKIDSTVSKEKQSLTRVVLFPFALVFDIAISPIYIVGGTIIMLYIGIVGPE